MNKQSINFDKYASNIFYNDGKNIKSWSDAHEVAKSLIAFFEKSNFEPGDIIAINANKDFFTYCAIMSCYLYGITFSPIKFNEVDNIYSKDKLINISCYLSSNDTLLKEQILICDVLESSVYKEPKQIFRINNDEDIAYILHSSGSTGNPKIIPIAYKSLNSYIESIDKITDINNGSIFAQTVELTFDLSMHDLFLCFSHGGTLVPLSASIAKFAPRFIKSLEVNNLMIVPSFMTAMNNEGAVLDSVHNVFFCGEALGSNIGKQALDMFPNARIFNLYGPTETTVAVSYYELNYNNIYLNNIVSIGVPLPSSNFKLSDEQELLIGGIQVFNGYLSNDSENPIVTIDGNKFYKSGDICSFDGVNYNFISRIDYQIKYRGYRIELEGIESSLGNKLHGGFAAIGYNKVSSSNYSDLALFFDSKLVSMEEIKSSFPLHLQGVSIKKIDIIPRNSNGKIDRHKLKGLLS